MTLASLRHPSERPLDVLHTVALATCTPMAYLSWPQGLCLWATDSFTKLLTQDLAAPEVQGKAAQALFNPHDWRAWQEQLKQLEATRQHGASLRVELSFKTQQHIPTLLIAHTHENGEMFAVVVIPLQDLSCFEAMQMVQDSDTRMRRYANATSESIIFFRHGRIFDANPAAITLTGYPLDQLLDRPVQHLLPHVLRAKALPLFEQGTGGAHETRLLHHSGQELDVEITVNLLPEDGNSLGLMVLRNITERKRAEAELHFLAYHDPLTRLPNRQGLMRQLQHALQHAEHFKHAAAVLYVDLDRFKEINDSLGHDAGDKLLVEVARRLRSKVHPDDIVARLAADEFVVVLSSPLTACQPECILREIRFVLSKPYTLHNGQLNVPASIGISLYPEDGGSAQELMLNASAAMKTAKSQGQGALQYYSALLHMRPSHLLLQDRLLREAIEQDKGLVLHYQPQWNHATNRLESFEALVRWQHPERGLLPPAEFIDFAEQRGLISLLGRWVMRTACKQLRIWRNAGLPPVGVSINMSAVEFSQSNLLDEVEQALTDANIEPQWLEIELTETTLMKQSEHVLNVLDALKQLGVRLSVDDFGTGYSSLAYLKRYPLDKLKIDRAFIKDTPDDQGDVSLVTAIIQMAHSLNLRTVAEGVETQAQWNLLKRLGCDLIQGYYLSRPMSAEDAMRWQQYRCQMAAPQ